MSIKPLGWAVALAAAVTISAPATSRDNDRGWERLGTRSVSLLADRDVIPVSAVRGDFRRIQLHVRGNAVFINSLVVVYGNGANDHIPISFRIPENGRSRVIDLRGGDRVTRRIELSYRAVPNGRGRAVIEVYGRR